MSLNNKPGEVTVLTYGTFDLFHIGHVRILKRLARFGQKLIVGCATDEFNAIKGKAAVMSYEQRREILRSCRFVDQVIPEENWDQKRLDVVKYDVGLLGMGDDWAGKFDDLSDLCDVIYLPRTPDISTTEVKGRINADHHRMIADAEGNAKAVA